MDPPRKRLGVSLFPIDMAMDNYACAHARICGCEGNLVIEACSRITSAESVALHRYLAGRVDKCADWCRKTGEATHYFLLGDWMQKVKNDRDVVDPSCWFESQPCWHWVTSMESGLGWSSVGGHWDLVDSLLDFLTPKIECDPDGGKVSREYYWTLRDWLRKGDLSRVEQAKRLRGAGSKLYHQLCDVMVATEAQDQAAMAKAFTAHVKHFLKGRRHEHHFPLNATFLWNYAKQRRKITCELPEDIQMYLFELPEA